MERRRRAGETGETLGPCLVGGALGRECRPLTGPRSSSRPIRGPRGSIATTPRPPRGDGSRAADGRAPRRRGRNGRPAAGVLPRDSSLAWTVAAALPMAAARSSAAMPARSMRAIAGARTVGRVFLRPLRPGGPQAQPQRVVVAQHVTAAPARARSTSTSAGNSKRNAWFQWCGVGEVAARRTSAGSGVSSTGPVSVSCGPAAPAGVCTTPFGELRRSSGAWRGPSA